MNSDEKKAYEALSSEEKKLYHKIESEHPQWTPSKILAKIQLAAIEESVLEDDGNNGGCGNPTPEEYVIAILKQFKKWTQISLPDLFITIGSLIDNAISAISAAILSGIRYLKTNAIKAWEEIKNFFK